MFYSFLCFFICLFSAFLVRSFIIKCPVSRTMIQHPPPSPPALPIIGHLHLLSSILPKSFQDLATRYGPLIRVRLGASTCIVASNASVAKEILKTQELNFISRPEFGSSDYNIYRGSSFVTAQYGVYWRFMKKLCMTELLTNSQINRFVHIREQEITNLLKSLIMREGEPCDLSMELTTMTNNVICRMAMSTRCSETGNEAKEIKELVKEVLEVAGKLSVGEVLGPLAKLDLFGNGRKLGLALGQFDRLVERIMKEHEEKAIDVGCERERRDLMDIMLDSCRDANAEVKLSRNDIKAFFLEIFMAGTDTSSVAMQWALAELINHPQVFKKLREEIQSVVGSSRLVKESDVPNLPYLQAVVKETLRLHPSAPLVIRECADDCKISGFDLKAKTRMLINVYAIMRDPDSWKDPNEFVPERFLVDSNENLGHHQMEIKGQNFRYLPFGSGRRGCPGASLVLTVMHATIGALVQCFDWKVKGGEKVDLKEGSGFSTAMAHPLLCYPITHYNPLYRS